MHKLNQLICLKYPQFQIWSADQHTSPPHQPAAVDMLFHWYLAHVLPQQQMSVSLSAFFNQTSLLHGAVFISGGHDFISAAVYVVEWWRCITSTWTLLTKCTVLLRRIWTKTFWFYLSTPPQWTIKNYINLKQSTFIFRADLIIHIPLFEMKKLCCHFWLSSLLQPFSQHCFTSAASLGQNILPPCLMTGYASSTACFVLKAYIWPDIDAFVSHPLCWCIKAYGNYKISAITQILLNLTVEHWKLI